MTKIRLSFLSLIFFFLQSARVHERSDDRFVKEDIVLYAATTWFKEFSRSFDAFVSSGPKLPKMPVILAINSRGILVFPKDNDKAPPLLGLDFSQLKKVESIRFVSLKLTKNTLYFLYAQVLDMK